MGEAAIDAVYPDARNPFAHPELLADEGLDARTVDELWLMAAPEERLNHVVDVTDTFDRKSSRCGSTGRRRRTWTISTAARAWQTSWATKFGLAGGRLAEAFQVLSVG